MTDYHRNPLLAWRPPRELSGWARNEAERRRQRIGDFLTSLLAAEQQRITTSPVAAKSPKPPAGRKAAGKSGSEGECKHSGVGRKQRCKECGRYNV